MVSTKLTKKHIHKTQTASKQWNQQNSIIVKTGDDFEEVVFDSVVVENWKHALLSIGSLKNADFFHED